MQKASAKRQVKNKPSKPKYRAREKQALMVQVAAIFGWSRPMQTVINYGIGLTEEQAMILLILW